MLKNLLRGVRQRFYILDGKLAFDYRIKYSYDTSRKAELLITQRYRAIALGFEASLCGYRFQNFNGARIHSFCLLGLHFSHIVDGASLIETVEGRILTANTRQFIKMKEMP